MHLESIYQLMIRLKDLHLIGLLFLFARLIKPSSASYLLTLTEAADELLPIPVLSDLQEIAPHLKRQHQLSYPQEHPQEDQNTCVGLVGLSLQMTKFPCLLTLLLQHLRVI